jgi:hypothetical protein
VSFHQRTEEELRLAQVIWGYSLRGACDADHRHRMGGRNRYGLVNARAQYDSGIAWLIRNDSIGISSNNSALWWCFQTFRDDWGILSLYSEVQILQKPCFFLSLVDTLRNVSHAFHFAKLLYNYSNRSDGTRKRYSQLFLIYKIVRFQSRDIFITLFLLNAWAQDSELLRHHIERR